MSFSLRTVLMGAALVAWVPACDATVERQRPESGRDGADPVDAQRGDVDPEGDTQGGDVDPDGDVDPSVDPGDVAPSSLCPSSIFTGGAEDAIAVTWSPDAVHLVLRDGALVELDLPTDDAPSDAPAGVNVVVGGDRVVVTRGWSLWGDVPRAHATVRWFDRRGALVDELISDEGLSAGYVTADGTTILYRSIGPAGPVVRAPDGAVRELAGFDFWGELVGSAWLRGYDTTQERPAFLNLATDERLVLEATVAPAWVDDGFAYLEQAEGGVAVVHVTPDATSRIALPALAGTSVANLSLVPVSHSTFSLVTDAPTGRSWRLDLASGALDLFATAVPVGSELIDDTCGMSPVMLTTSGALVAGLRTRGDGQAAVGEVSGAWQPIGLPVEQPGIFDVVETAGTFVVTSGEANESFCPILGWDEPASEGALPRDAVQLVRPSAGVVRVLDAADPWSVVTTHDGGCASFTRGAWDGVAITRSVVDVATGEPLEVPGDSFVWIP